MKNILHFLSFSLTNSVNRPNKKSLFILAIGILLLTSDFAHAQLPITYDSNADFQTWTSNGNRSGRFNNSSWSCSDSYSLYTRGNDTSRNVNTSPEIDLQSYSEVTITFCHKAINLENGEGFRLQFYNGSNWSTVNTFTLGDEFTNQGAGNEHTLSATITDAAFSFANDSRFRLYGTANNNNEYNFFDDITITGILGTPPNDLCSNAIMLTSDTSCNPVTGTTVNGTQSLPGCAGTANDDVWYSFVATGPEHTITVDRINIYDIVFEVFTGGCNGTSLVCENSTSTTESETTTLLGLTTGSTYYIRVYSRSSSSNHDGGFTICITEPIIPPPSNDDCSNAISLNPEIICTPTMGTTVGGTQSLTGCSGTANDDVWYSFVAERPEHTIIVERLSILDIVFEVFIGSCNGTSLVCENSTGTLEDETTTLVGLNVGTTYLIRVYSRSSSTNHNGTFNICVLLPCEATNVLGTSSLACPSVDAGGLGSSGSDVTINCSTGSTQLVANYLQLGETTDYDVNQITYNPPYQFGCLANPVSVNVDDVWSPVVNLPFDFCFYGNTYDSCVIGSNGVISFNDGLAGNASGWQFTEDVPTFNNTTGRYYGASIYGVHHDVDPSVGGEIGYQLITLDTGCRALVAAWNDVPMYANNSLKYTGMIVLYEDTNIIEVYIEEKVALNSWNDGNACIGIQANSTTGKAAPNRNSSDDNWSTTNEAWRFTPSGNSITTLKWYENSISAANEIIDSDNDGQIEVNPTKTTTYYAEVTYDLCSGETLVELDPTTVTVEGNKTWNGSQSNAWEDPDNWTPVGVPELTNCITIPPTSRDPAIDNATDGTGYNMIILDDANLLQRSNSSLTIEDKVTIEPNASFRIRNNASLIQINDVATNENTGIAEIRRRANGLGDLDYVYWSSPVEDFNVTSISPGSPISTIYNWNPTVANGTIGEHGAWTNTTENMISGKGYIVRGLISTPATNQAEFVGTLNNGQISFPISRGTWTGADYAGIGNIATAQDDNWNLLGNPYPSAISLTDFVTANPTIDGTLYFWRHIDPATTAIDNPFYENYSYNYNPDNYLAANSLGSTPAGFNGFIASGQGFFALMLDSAPTPNNVYYNNTMRGLYPNDDFFRNSPETSNEKHRIWLDFIDNNNSAISTLIGFANGASDDIDRLYDGFLINQSNTQFYSLESDNKLAIQGKALPFDQSKTIPLGYQIPTDGNYTISLNQVDGLFENTNQNIYLEDTELNTIHDLRANPYTFTSNVGTYNDRFILRFTNQALSIKDQDIISDLEIRSIDKNIETTSNLSSIKTFELFDLTGRIIHKNLNIDDMSYNMPTHNLSTGAYIVKVSLDTGTVVTKKIVIQ
ncbi:T9SS type A sorting domain-containing protein [Winogradskyella eckloniae]|uniref:T9SS type A sorting domain-containing protein n=1 Tax=Winogradskyella eckloniae TaxID=1089306 RepID=UPI001564E3EA|nr:T9SS type A sorting domain-containing protein [Winogradskyella eckloniae]NRD19433.1 T9SS type A sorting domain-containing protein [Winogradskyella eckloniae]